MRLAAAPARLVGKIGWTVIDQGLSSLSNIALSIMVARNVSASAFGAFSVAFLVYGIAVAVVRPVAGQPLQIRHTGLSNEGFARQVSRAQGMTLLLGFAAAGVSAVVGGVGSGLMREAMWALAVVIPLLVLQETCRLAFFAHERADRAALIDGIWVAAMIVALAAVLLSGRHSVGLLILAWGAAGGVSAVVGLALLHAVPRIRQAWSWWRSERSIAGYLLGEYVLGLGAAQFGILLVGVLASQTAVGSLRAAQVLLGPLSILGVAAFNSVIPEVSRSRGNSRREVTVGLVATAAMGLLTLSYASVLLLLPDRIGAELFGETWQGASAVLLAMCLSSLCSGMACGPAAVLYGLGQAKKTFAINCIKAPVLFAVLIPMTLHGGVMGAAWGLCIVEAFVLPFWIVTFVRAARRSAPRPELATAPA